MFWYKKHLLLSVDFCQHDPYLLVNLMKDKGFYFAPLEYNTFHSPTSYMNNMLRPNYFILTELCICLVHQSFPTIFFHLRFYIFVSMTQSWSIWCFCSFWVLLCRLTNIVNIFPSKQNYCDIHCCIYKSLQIFTHMQQFWTFI